jgi:hypothetical protein
MSPSVVEINEGIAHVSKETCDKILIYLIKKGEFKSLWEMQDVEDFEQTNEGKNEEGKNISM